MSAPTTTRDLAWSAAQDDYRLAVATFDRLWPEEMDYTEDTFDTHLSGLFPEQPRWTCSRCGRRTIGGQCNGCGRRYEVHHVVDPTNNDLNNLEIRTADADSDREEKS